MTPHRADRDQVPEKEEKPALFGSWNRFYLFVILHLAFLISLFYIFTKAFD